MSKKPGRGKQCVYIKEDGSRCKGNAIKGTDYCSFHSDLPSVKEKMRLGRLQGAGTRVIQRIREEPPIPLRTPQDALTVLEDALNLIRAVGTEPDRYGALVTQFVRAGLEAMKLIQTEEVSEQELVELDEAIREVEKSAEIDLAKMPPHLREAFEEWMSVSETDTPEAGH